MSEATAAEILAFRDDRRWLPYHNPKDLAMSVAIEAGELLEVFQWSGTDLERGEKRGELADELADVLIYAAMLADRAGLSMDDIVRAKLAKSAARYPVDKVKGLGSESYERCRAEARKAGR
ncbi:MAG: nucleotide pyrophosphohydrolase [Sutterella sp. 63_29]|nr:MAG: nucleotide pyrophosphohydrolase [Sutterella sp. 63_29]